MTLLEYIKTRSAGEEIAVHDKNYEMESYFYNDKPEDKWDKAMLKIASVLDVVEIEKRDGFFYVKGVTVNLSELIEKKLDKLKEAELFITPTVNAIMHDMMNILSGYVSEDWLMDFANVLVKE